MMMVGKLDGLSERLVQQLRSDGLMPIGRFHIQVPVFLYEVDTVASLDWIFSVYAWVSVAGEGAVMRIGKCEGKLRTRLAAYKKSLDAAMSGRLGAREYFKGDTQPLETEGWVRLVGGQTGGFIFAKSLAQNTLGGASGQILAGCAARLIRQYDPPLCGVSSSGRRAKREWETQHGATTAIAKRGMPPISQAASDRL